MAYPPYGYPPAPGYPAYPPAPGYPAYPPAFPGRRFYIVSELHGKVLDIEGGSRMPGAHVIVWPRKHMDSLNQLWYIDAQNVIRSCFNDFALEAHSDGQHVRMEPFNGQASQRWMFSGNRIMRDGQNCLDIEGGAQHDGAKIIQWNYKGSSNQHWRIDYV